MKGWNIMDDREAYLVDRIKKLEASLEQAEAGTKEIGMLVDALMIDMARRYGQNVSGDYILMLPYFDARTLTDTFSVKVEKVEQSYKITANRTGVI